MVTKKRGVNAKLEIIPTSTTTPNVLIFFICHFTYIYPLKVNENVRWTVSNHLFSLLRKGNYNHC